MFEYDDESGKLKVKLEGAAAYAVVVFAVVGMIYTVVDILS